MDYIYKEQVLNISIDVFRGQSTIKEDFSRADMKVLLVCGLERKKKVIDAGLDETGTIRFTLTNLAPGVYGIKIIWRKNNERAPLYAELYNIFGITEFPEEATNPSKETVNINAKLRSASYGYDGLDAYELAVLRGKTKASEEEWLQSRGVTATVQDEGSDPDSVMSQAAVTESLCRIRKAISSAYNMKGTVAALPTTAEEKDAYFLLTNEHTYVCVGKYAADDREISYKSNGVSIPDSVATQLSGLKVGEANTLPCSSETHPYFTLSKIGNTNTYKIYVCGETGYIPFKEDSLAVAYVDGELVIAGNEHTANVIIKTDITHHKKGDAIFQDFGQLVTNDYTPKAKDTEYEPTEQSMLAGKTNAQDALDKVCVVTPSLEQNLIIAANVNAQRTNMNFNSLLLRFNRLVEIIQLLIDRVMYDSPEGFKDMKDLISGLEFEDLKTITRVTSGGTLSSTTAVSGSAKCGSAVCGKI